ncbi:S-layer protein domain-containing protein [Methanolobus sp. ZRKC5]|uniref:S-layer protein domain-containing protein n=1 Tax=unclassified Methanolobus TaxID=2629569 RepID=UPI00313AA7BC
MKKMTWIMIVFAAILVLVTMPVNALDVTYKIRSTVYDNTDSYTPAGDFYWDANSFSGFWYQIKPGLSSEIIYIHNSVNSSSTIQLRDEIDEGDLYYVSKPQAKKTKIGGSDDGATYIVDEVDLKKYYLMGLFGSQYVAMPEDSSDLSAGCKPDEIAKILLQFSSDDKKQMFSKEEWDLTDGWSLVVQQVDVEGNKVWIQLNRNGEEVDSAVVSGDMNLTKPERTYLYKDSDDNPMFYCYVDSIFKGTSDDFVVFKYAFLVGDITTIESGDTYGVFDVQGFEIPAVMNGTDYVGSGSGTVLYTGDDALVMSSNDGITLGPNEVIDLYGGIYLKTEDTSGSCLKMTLWKTCTITVADTVTEEGDVSVGNDNDIVVVDMAEEETETENVGSVKDYTDFSMSAEDTGGDVVQSSVAAPGFELLLCLLGLLGALGIRKYENTK